MQAIPAHHNKTRHALTGCVLNNEHCANPPQTLTYLRSASAAAAASAASAACRALS